MNTLTCDLTENEMRAISGGDFGVSLISGGASLMGQGIVNMQNGSVTTTMTTSFGAQSGLNVGETVTFSGTWIVGASELYAGAALVTVGSFWEAVDAAW